MDLSLQILHNVTEFKKFLKVCLFLYIMFFIILGPGFYDISSNTTTAKVRNNRLKKPKKTGFVYSAPQTLSIAEKEVSSGPGPCDYQVIC